MLKILILICPIAIDHTHCDLSNAIDVVRGMRVASAQQCGFMAMVTLAPTSLVPDPSKQYVKIVCPKDQVASR